MKKKPINPVHKQIALGHALQIVGRYSRDLPKQHSSNKQERRDAQWIQDKKKALKGIGKTIWIPELDELFSKHGFPNAFETKDPKAEALKRAEDIAKKSKERGSLPNNHSPDVLEKKGAAWIQARKQAKMGKGLVRWYPEFEKIFAKHGFPNAFELRRR